MKLKIPTPQIPCPCCSGQTYGQCCGPFIHLGQKPQNAEQLMRSRFSASSRKAYKYLMNTWHPSTRPQKPPTTGATQWISLEILNRDLGDQESYVEFKAVYDHAGHHTHTLHENSHFRFEAGQWFYLDGEIRSQSGCGQG